MILTDTEEVRFNIMPGMKKVGTVGLLPIDSIRDNLRDMRPTVCVCVARYWSLDEPV